MTKTKAFVLTAIVLFFFGNQSAWASESENLATFEADPSTQDSDLQESVESLKNDLTEMKNGMSALQAKMLEAEMAQLKAQLSELQTSLNTPKYFDLDSLGSIDISDLDLKSGVNLGEDADLATQLATAQAEIAKLKAALEAKEEEPIYEPLEEVEPKIEEESENEEDEIEVDEKMEAAADEAEKIAKEEKEKNRSSNIIAKADGQLLYQFPRSLASESEEPIQIEAQNLKADILAEETMEETEPIAPNFTRQAADPEFQIFSVQNVTAAAILLLTVIGILVYFLLKNERKLLANQNAPLGDMKSESSFPLANYAQKNKKSTKN